MSVSLRRENFTLHKIHSLTGVIPVGYYMVQHLMLNTFSLAGPAYFNAVINFFDGMPWYVLLTIEVLAIWLPLMFHAVYGIFIVDRSQGNYFTGKYKFAQNRMYTFQRYTGIFLFVFLIYHVVSTTGVKYLHHDSHLIKFAAWHAKLTSYDGLILLFYLLGVLTASYHLCFGLWNFCIRWGITVSEDAQEKVQKISGVAFVLVTLMGWAALAGFLIPHRNIAPIDSSAPVPAIYVALNK